jgi:hypothetical protein
LYVALIQVGPTIVRKNFILNLPLVLDTVMLATERLLMFSLLKQAYERARETKERKPTTDSIVITDIPSGVNLSRRNAVPDNYILILQMLRPLSNSSSLKPGQTCTTPVSPADVAM